jgi:serine kinase of HPr protein (carbohydrate metabolism regulator)
LSDAPELVHGTAVALGRTAALLRGPSGSGKSDLALRFLFLARRGPAALEAPILVADDQVYLVRNGERLQARCPDTIRGRIEVRGIGIVEVKALAEAELGLVVDLVAPSQVERLPEAAATVRLMGVELPLVRLSPWEASAPIKLAIALARAKHS